ncbi:inosine/xanthosine triphosphatase [Deinococcus peraridilitoris]|uniref:Probable inosine/xanthosine triphosphatase n=1 Tax=Deinococcus peraridilitoris (strain DSM 19664 / LMG 22246 / CIP 109416 / KR-200) TaxID=937777 RepID=L0A463_DEIPD|nr:inosine/xanthosine triphosphatase [Deinococcus peraridilitoris]AFZ68219.1 inosine/xanthosine triphosphatase [Deinococcus peraridilitoris DSM 19664]
MIVVGSTNPAKVNPVRDVMTRLFADLEVRGAQLPSGVPEQPIGFQETLQGARNRAQAAVLQPGAVWGVGLEGGVEFDDKSRGWLFGMVAVAHAGRVTYSRSASLELPPRVTLRVRAGEELGPVMNELSGVQDNNRKTGAIGFLTGGLLERADVWRQTLALALAPHLSPELYG